MTLNYNKNMKIIIMSLVIGGLLVTTASAADYMNIVKVQADGSNTRVSFERVYDDHLLMSGDYIFENKPSMQELVNKVAMRCDDNITVNTKLASTTAVKGKVQEFAMARYEAFQKGSIAGYLIELAKQMGMMK